MAHTDEGRNGPTSVCLFVLGRFRGHLLDIYVLLREGNLNVVFVERVVDALHDV